MVLLSFNSGVLGGTRAPLCSWAPTLERDDFWQRAPPVALRGRRPAALGRQPWRRRIQRREGAGRCRGPGSGHRPRRASSAVLPRSSPLLIFGLGCPCPGISRHASRRPVRRPEPGRKGGRLGQRRRRRRRRRLPGTSMSPRRTLPRPFLLCLCLSLCLAAAAARGAVQSGELGLAPPPLVCPHARTLPSSDVTPTSAPLRAPAAPPSASCREPPSPEPKRGAGGARRIEGGQGWLRPRRREASGSVADTLSRPGSEPEPEGGSGPTWAPEGGAWQGGWGRDAASGSGGRGSAAGTTSESPAPRRGVCVSGAGGYSCAAAAEITGPGAWERPSRPVPPAARPGGAPGSLASRGTAPGAAGAWRQAAHPEAHRRPRRGVRLPRARLVSNRPKLNKIPSFPGTSFILFCF